MIGRIAQDRRGFTLIELLLAVSIFLAVTSAVFALIAPAQNAFQAQPEVADMQQRLRAATETLRSHLLMAGAGISHGRVGRGPLSSALAPVLPYRTGDLRSDPASGVFYRRDAMTVVYIPSAAAQATIVTAAGGGRPLDLELAPNCGPMAAPDRVCGFSETMRVALVDRGGAWNAATVLAVNGDAVQVDAARPLMSSYESGEAAAAEVEMHTYSLKADPGSGMFQLVHYDGRLTELPVVDDVVTLQFAYFGEPLPPALLPGADLAAGEGPWTTYGPRPPPIDHDEPGDSWPPGENCLFAVVDGAHVPRLASLPQGALVALEAPVLTDGPWCPGPESDQRYDADLFRIRRVEVVIRVQVGAASFRGPAGRLFQRGGTARAAERLVPDQEIRFGVTPRNLGSGR